MDDTTEITAKLTPPSTIYAKMVGAAGAVASVRADANAMPGTLRAKPLPQMEIVSQKVSHKILSSHAVPVSNINALQSEQRIKTIIIIDDSTPLEP